MPVQLIDRPSVGESNGLVDGQAYHRERDVVATVTWDVKGLYITRLRLLSDRGYDVWDVSYCHGTLGGRDVNVELPFSQLPKRGWKAAIVKLAQREGIYAKGLGILYNVSTLE